MKIKAQEKKTIKVLSSDVVTSSGGDNGHEGVITTFVSVGRFFMPSAASCSGS